MRTTVTFPGLGLEFEVSRVVFTLFGMEIYWYGLILATGLMVGILIGYRKAKAFGIDSDRMTDVILVTTILAVLCSRLYYVLFYPGDYDTLWKVLNMRDGGLAIYGAVIGAFVFGFLMCRLRRVPVLAMFDLTALGFLAGQGIGRWGNFVNQEAFGTNTTLPWGMYSSQTKAYLQGVAGQLAAQGVYVDPNAPVHPTFLYESLWCLLGLVLLLCYVKRRRYDGEIVLLYVAWYGAERCLVEGIRTDSLMWGPLRVSQVLAGASCVLALALWYICRRRAVRRAAAGLPTLAVQRVRAAADAKTRYEMACASRAAALRKRDAVAAQQAEEGMSPVGETAPIESNTTEKAAEKDGAPMVDATQAAEQTAEAVKQANLTETAAERPAQAAGAMPEPGVATETPQTDEGAAGEVRHG